MRQLTPAVPATSLARSRHLAAAWREGDGQRRLAAAFVAPAGAAEALARQAARLFRDTGWLDDLLEPLIAGLAADLHATLAPLLAVRGLRLALGDEHAAIVASPAPVRNARWLALAGDEAGAVAALDRGAADAALPGESPVLLAARIARLARPERLRVGGLEIDPIARRATRDGRPLALLPREYAVLLELARHADELVTRPALRTAVWGRIFDPGTNVIEVHVSRLRAALDRDAAPMLLTERGRGYRLASDPAIAAVARAS